MKKPSVDTPSNLVFSVARRIAEDMREGVDDICDELVFHIQALDGMAECLKETKRNIERYAIPIAPRRSAQRKDMRKKIIAINKAIETAKKIQKSLELTLDDVNDMIKPGGFDKKTQDFLSKMMEGPTDDDLRNIEDEGFDDLPPS